MMNWPTQDLLLESPGVPFSTERYLTGYGEQRGGVAVRFVNTGMKSASILYLDVLPWYMKLYMHTLRFSVNGVMESAGMRSLVDRA